MSLSSSDGDVNPTAPRESVDRDVKQAVGGAGDVDGTGGEGGAEDGQVQVQVGTEGEGTAKGLELRLDGGSGSEDVEGGQDGGTTFEPSGKADDDGRVQGLGLTGAQSPVQSSSSSSSAEAPITAMTSSTTTSTFGGWLRGLTGFGPSPPPTPSKTPQSFAVPDNLNVSAAAAAAGNRTRAQSHSHVRTNSGASSSSSPKSTAAGSPLVGLSSPRRFFSTTNSSNSIHTITPSSPTTTTTTTTTTPSVAPSSPPVGPNKSGIGSRWKSSNGPVDKTGGKGSPSSFNERPLPGSFNSSSSPPSTTKRPLTASSTSSPKVKPSGLPTINLTNEVGNQQSIGPTSPNPGTGGGMGGGDLGEENGNGDAEGQEEGQEGSNRRGGGGGGVNTNSSSSRSGSRTPTRAPTANNTPNSSSPRKGSYESPVDSTSSSSSSPNPSTYPTDPNANTSSFMPALLPNLNLNISNLAFISSIGNIVGRLSGATGVAGGEVGGVGDDDEGRDGKGGEEGEDEQRRLGNVSSARFRGSMDLRLEDASANGEVFRDNVTPEPSPGLDSAYSTSPIDHQDARTPRPFDHHLSPSVAIHQHHHNSLLPAGYLRKSPSTIGTIEENPSTSTSSPTSASSSPKAFRDSRSLPKLQMPQQQQQQQQQQSPQHVQHSFGPPSPSFLLAEERGRLDPVTLHAIARTTSEADALRVVREREERDKELDVFRVRQERQEALHRLGMVGHGRTSSASGGVGPLGGVGTLGMAGGESVEMARPGTGGSGGSSGGFNLNPRRSLKFNMGRENSTNNSEVSSSSTSVNVPGSPCQDRPSTARSTATTRSSIASEASQPSQLKTPPRPGRTASYTSSSLTNANASPPSPVGHRKTSSLSFLERASSLGGGARSGSRRSRQGSQDTLRAGVGGEVSGGGGDADAVGDVGGRNGGLGPVLEDEMARGEGDANGNGGAVNEAESSIGGSPVVTAGMKREKRKSLLSRLLPSPSKTNSREKPPKMPQTSSSFSRDDEEPQGRASMMMPSSASTASLAASEGKKVKYVKVRTKNKSHKEFGKLFLAQELRLHSPQQNNNSPYNLTAETGSVASSIDEGSQHSATTGAGETPSRIAHRKENSVWAMRFSADGQYLAAAGQDGVVRVWQVLSNQGDRETVVNGGVPPDNAHLWAGYSVAPDGGPKGACSAPTSASSSSQAPPPSNPPPSSGKKGESAFSPHLPIFGSRPLHEFKGHTADVLDLSWSKNNFLLSSSMDKTVRLWHVTRKECLCVFQHLDFVTSIAFHPRNDRFFLSGSLDCKLRLWNIVEKRVQSWTLLPELITSVAFTTDGKLAIAGSFVGVCMFFETDTFKFHTLLNAKSTRGKNSKGRKITSIAPLAGPGPGEDRLLITSNDSRVRLYNLLDKTLETKYKGHENTSSQIRASFSDDGRYLISGSEDRHVYIWESGVAKGIGGSIRSMMKKEKGGFEYFGAKSNIVTCCIFAPQGSALSLAKAGDPIFASDARTVMLSRIPSGSPGSVPISTLPSSASTVSTTGLAPTISLQQAQDSPSSAENAIIVVADDHTGVIRVFRNSTLTAGPGDGPSQGSMKRRASITFGREPKSLTTDDGLYRPRAGSNSSAVSGR